MKNLSSQVLGLFIALFIFVSCSQQDSQNTQLTAEKDTSVKERQRAFSLSFNSALSINWLIFDVGTIRKKNTCSFLEAQAEGNSGSYKPTQVYWVIYDKKNPDDAKTLKKVFFDEDVLSVSDFKKSDDREAVKFTYPKDEHITEAAVGYDNAGHEDDILRYDVGGRIDAYVKIVTYASEKKGCLIKSYYCKRDNKEGCAENKDVTLKEPAKRFENHKEFNHIRISAFGGATMMQQDPTLLVY